MFSDANIKNIAMLVWQFGLLLNKKNVVKKDDIVKNIT